MRAVVSCEAYASLLRHQGNSTLPESCTSSFAINSLPVMNGRDRGVVVVVVAVVVVAVISG